MLEDNFEKTPGVAYFPLVLEALNALHSLSPVERGILSLRFGLDDGVEHGREEVAKHYGVPADVIRALEMEALRKLRNPESYCQRQNERPKRKPSHLHLVQ